MCLSQLLDVRLIRGLDVLSVVIAASKCTVHAQCMMMQILQLVIFPVHKHLIYEVRYCESAHIDPSIASLNVSIAVLLKPYEIDAITLTKTIKQNC